MPSLGYQPLNGRVERRQREAGPPARLSLRGTVSPERLSLRVQHGNAEEGGEQVAPPREVHHVDEHLRPREWVASVPLVERRERQRRVASWDAEALEHGPMLVPRTEHLRCFVRISNVSVIERRNW